MSISRGFRISRFAALFALLLFSGDIAADSLADMQDGHCISETSRSDSQHEKAPCSHCSCAIHVGTVIVADSSVRLIRAMQPGILLCAGDTSMPPPQAASIDHPPQLA
jgi:hypothetical protein